MAFYAADGSWNITVVDGQTRVGRFNANGSTNVVNAETEATPGKGQFHPSGALRVTVATADKEKGVGHYAKDGSLLVSEDGLYEAQKVTVVAGSL
jgi:hypothetical protein